MITKLNGGVSVDRKHFYQFSLLPTLDVYVDGGVLYNDKVGFKLHQIIIRGSWLCFWFMLSRRFDITREDIEKQKEWDKAWEETE